MAKVFFLLFSRHRVIYTLALVVLWTLSLCLVVCNFEFFLDVMHIKCDFGHSICSLFEWEKSGK